MAKRSAKYKKMTVREKKLRAEMKKELQEKGILPPNKPRLNRKKFALDTWKEFREECLTFEAVLELRNCLGYFVMDKMVTVSDEEVGILKLMKAAVETVRFKEKLKTEGRSSYSYGELYDVIAPIINL